MHSQSVSSINIPVNSDNLREQQRSDKFCKYKVKESHHQSQILSWMTKEYGGNWYKCITTGHQMW